MTDASNGCYDIPDEVTSYRYRTVPDEWCHELRDEAVTWRSWPPWQGSYRYLMSWSPCLSSYLMVMTSVTKQLPDVMISMPKQLPDGHDLRDKAVTWCHDLHD